MMPDAQISSPPGYWRILLFGQEARACQRTELVILDQRPSLTIAQLSQQAALVEPRLAPYLDTARWAVNQSFADQATLVQPGDEIALIGMVSGG
jgi:molybdopterin converting factor small subunit